MPIVVPILVPIVVSILLVHALVHSVLPSSPVPLPFCAAATPFELKRRQEIKSSGIGWSHRRPSLDPAVGFQPPITPIWRMGPVLIRMDSPNSRLNGPGPRAHLNPVVLFEGLQGQALRFAFREFNVPTNYKPQGLTPPSSPSSKNATRFRSRAGCSRADRRETAGAQRRQLLRHWGLRERPSSRDPREEAESESVRSSEDAGETRRSKGTQEDGMRNGQTNGRDIRDSGEHD